MSKALVAYFSASGVTAKLANTLVKAVDGDLFEIKPKVPYTSADLNWMNKKCRSAVEMSDSGTRPPIANKVDNMNQYDVIFVGFPVWWYRQPSIIDTFMESYDFSGKTVVPFATSGSSAIGNSGSIMQKITPSAKVVVGQRFNANASEGELATWASEWL